MATRPTARPGARARAQAPLGLEAAADELDGSGQAGNTPEYSVSEISGELKRTVEQRFGHVRVRGEISNYRGVHASGHAYFSLKDEGARIDAVVWRTSFSRMRVKPEEGMEVVATGRLTTFPGKSAYQIVIEQLEPAGVGALMAMIEERRRRFAAEGLFDVERKRPLPFLPAVIGVVTSPTGAVIRDILHRIADRFPRRVLLWPVRVQGDGSAAEVAAAIRGFDALGAGGAIPRPDVLIVARGGGSLEDLWGFNDEAVVRAAAECSIPLVSAVGHETDWTLIDHAADLRAPTPTGAAEVCVPVRVELAVGLDRLHARHGSAMLRRLDGGRDALRSAARALPSGSHLLDGPRQRLDRAVARLPSTLRAGADARRLALARLGHRLSAQAPHARLGRATERVEGLGLRLRRAERVEAERRRDRLAGFAKLLGTLGYRSVLNRGYALVRDATGQPLHAAAGIAPGARLAIEFTDATIAAEALGPDGERPREAPRSAARLKPAAASAVRQGNLF